jgi:hypothetical protein
LVWPHTGQFPVSIRKLVERRLGILGTGLGMVMVADPGGMSKLAKTDLPSIVRALPVLAGEIVDLGE